MSSKKSKRIVSDDDSTSDSGPDDRNPPPKKAKAADKEKPAKKTTSSNDEEPSWPIDRLRFVKVRDFKNKLYVDIREYYDKNGEQLPGKKGISLSMSQWNKLKEHIDDIQEAIDRLS